MKHFLIVRAAAVLLSTTAIGAAEEREPPSARVMTPLPEEQLPKAIWLSGKCSGIAIREWVVTNNGSVRKPAAIRYMDRLCNQAVGAFGAFAAERKLVPAHSEQFNWRISLLPDGDCYRCLNDLKYRFAYRAVQRPVWGYTGLYERYSFLLNEIYVVGVPDRMWRRVWVHELFHALSMHYGIFWAHADDNEERARIDERYAREFVDVVLSK